MDTLDKRMIHIPGAPEPDGTRCHHATQNGMQFKCYELKEPMHPYVHGSTTYNSQVLETA